MHETELQTPCVGNCLLFKNNNLHICQCDWHTDTDTRLVNFPFSSCTTEPDIIVIVHWTDYIAVIWFDFYEMGDWWFPDLSSLCFLFCISTPQRKQSSSWSGTSWTVRLIVSSPDSRERGCVQHTAVWPAFLVSIYCTDLKEDAVVQTIDLLIWYVTINYSSPLKKCSSL